MKASKVHVTSLKPTDDLALKSEEGEERTKTVISLRYKNAISFDSLYFYFVSFKCIKTSYKNTIFDFIFFYKKFYSQFAYYNFNCYNFLVKIKLL